MTDDLFSNTQSADTMPPSGSYKELLVGEGKKYKTEEDVAKAAWHASSYIKILEDRLDHERSQKEKLQEEALTGSSLRELLDQIQSRPSQSSPPPRKDEGNEPPQHFDPKKIDEMFDNKIKSYEEQKRQAANLDLVQSKLKQRYGSNYADKLSEQMDSLGLTKEDVNELARTRPQILIKTLGLEQEAPLNSPNLFSPPPPSSVRSDNFRPTAGNQRTWNYYQEMKKNNPNIYSNPKTALQMQEDAIKMGDAFYDGDFNRPDLDKPWTL